MKSLVIVCCLAASLGIWMAFGCGPKNKYCPENNGPCYTAMEASAPDVVDSGLGEAIILD